MWTPIFIRCILSGAGIALQGFPSLLKLKLSGWNQYLELKSSSLKSLTAIHSIDSGNMTFRSPKDLPQLRTVNLSIWTGYTQRDADNYKYGLQSHEVQQKRTVCFKNMQLFCLWQHTSKAGFSNFCTIALEILPARPNSGAQYTEYLSHVARYQLTIHNASASSVSFNIQKLLAPLAAMLQMRMYCYQAAVLEDNVQLL